MSLGPLHISSFGLFLALAFAASVFTAWRIGRSYDAEEEQVLDLTILTFFGAFIGARSSFILLHPDFFDNWLTMVLVNRYPGLFFWGGVVGGLITLWFFARRFKVSFWQYADFAAVATLIALALGDLGCFLGGCEYGVVSDSWWATSVVGLVGRRVPVGLIEAVIFFLAFRVLWRQAIRFHFAGKIAALFLMVVGVVKYILDNYRGDTHPFYGGFTLGQSFALAAFLSGVVVFYTQSRRNLLADLRYLIHLPLDLKEQQRLLFVFQKGWYNQRVSWRITISRWLVSLQKGPGRLKRKLNVKSTPTHLK